MEDTSFSLASAADLPALRAFLERCALPSADLQPDGLAHFILCWTGGRLSGSVGIERLGGLGLLRSLAVAPERRGRRLGHELWARARDEARRHGIAHLYLLTTTAEDLFARWGFRRIARDQVPDAIRATAEYATVCPSTAAVMTLELAAAAAAPAAR